MAKQIGNHIITEESTDYDYSVVQMYRVAGFLEQDQILIHVKQIGLKLLTWNYDVEQNSQETHTLKVLEVPEYHGEVDLLRTTADGNFLCIGMKDQNCVKFMKYDLETATYVEMPNSTLEVSTNIK